MENTKQEEIGHSVTNEYDVPPFVLIVLNQETGLAELSHSKILDNAYICDILSSALAQWEHKLSLEDEDGYTEH